MYAPQRGQQQEQRQGGGATSLSPHQGRLLTTFHDGAGKMEACYDREQDKVNAALEERWAWQGRWTGPEGAAATCTPLALGMNCDTYGAPGVRRFTQESALQGRMQALNSKCPECEVILLPKFLFSNTADGGTAKKTCHPFALNPAQTRASRSCNLFNESETVWERTMSEAARTAPEGYGPGAIAHINSRDVDRKGISVYQ